MDHFTRCVAVMNAFAAIMAEVASMDSDGDYYNCIQSMIRVIADDVTERLCKADTLDLLHWVYMCQVGSKEHEQHIADRTEDFYKKGSDK